MLRHAWPEAFPGAGVVGVVCFFALSGYLITGLLVRELESSGRVGLGGFYRRRSRRLVPALLALVGGVVLVTTVLDPLGDRRILGRTVLFALTWTGDLPFGHASSATFHLWTLAVEEQFYLVWPLFVALAWRRGRISLALGVAGTGSLLAAACTVLWLHDAPDLAYALPTTWAGCLVIGSAARVFQDRIHLPHRAAVVALAGVCLLALAPLRGHALTYFVVAPTVAALAAVLVLAWRRWWHVSTPPLRGLVRLGRVSYAAYLWNYPLALWLRPHDPSGLLALLLTLLAAALSWRLVERRFQRAADRARRRIGSGLRIGPAGDESVLVREDHDLNAVPQVQLAQDPTDMGLHG